MLARPILEELDGIPLLSFTTTPSNPVELVAKRAIDLALSLVLFLVTLPIQIAAALAILLTSGTPDLLPAGALRPERASLHAAEVPHDETRRRGAAFGDLAPERDDGSGLQGHPRPAPDRPSDGSCGGSRSTRLPQLWNVIVGDMSLVGPRPPLPDEVARYEPWQRRRLSMKPGLTCLWQVSGRSEVDFDRWMALDLKYIDTWSPLLDLKILLKTVPAVLSGRGAR